MKILWAVLIVLLAAFEGRAALNFGGRMAAATVAGLIGITGFNLFVWIGLSISSGSSPADRTRPRSPLPYEGRTVQGVSETVISRGRVIVEDNKFTGRKGAGEFIKRNPRV